MALAPILPLLHPVTDTYEEAFDLFVAKPPSKSLGFVSRTTSTITLEIPPYTLTISQSPTLLHSSLPGGTTGAVLWSVTPRLARWLCTPNNLLFQHAILSPAARVLELGAGAAAVLGCTAGRRVAWWGCSDMPYVLKLARENIAANLPPAEKRARRGKAAAAWEAGRVQTLELDWETSDVRSALAVHGVECVDVVVAADCVYNEALVEPFVNACAEAARVGREEDGARECVVVVAQELRSQDVFEGWLEAFRKRFRTWRVPDRWLGEELGAANGFVVHVGVLRKEGEVDEEEGEEEV